MLIICVIQSLLNENISIECVYVVYIATCDSLMFNS